jgi:hypothetical protein
MGLMQLIKIIIVLFYIKSTGAMLSLSVEEMLDHQPVQASTQLIHIQPVLTQTQYSRLQQILKQTQCWQLSKY